MFFGTRPEGIKLAPVIACLRRNASFTTIVVSTGQHDEMLTQVVRTFGIRVDHHLSVMEPDQALASLTARLLSRVDECLQLVRPDMALVQGDTTTVLATSLAAFYRGVAVGHVEAGLRTGNLRSPFPEEANRLLAGRIATLHFAPTEAARQNLLAEAVPPASVMVTGNTVVDALLLETARQDNAAVSGEIDHRLARTLGDSWPQIPFVLITGHRRESFGAGFARVCEAVRRLAERFPDHQFIYPVHLNPNVRSAVMGLLGGLPTVRLLPPLDYAAFVRLMRRCRLILTDSGGIQEEGPALGKPVLVMRDTTERPEGVRAGTAALVGTDADAIVRAVTELLSDSAAYAAMSTAQNPYGDGRAAERIVGRIRRYFRADS